jgi:hypothetical protein
VRPRLSCLPIFPPLLVPLFALGLPYRLVAVADGLLGMANIVLLFFSKEEDTGDDLRHLK